MALDVDRDLVRAGLLGMYLLGRASVATEVRPGMGADTFASAANGLGLGQLIQGCVARLMLALHRSLALERDLTRTPCENSSCKVALAAWRCSRRWARYYWVLSSVGANTPEALGELEAQAAEYNRWATDNVASGLEGIFCRSTAAERWPQLVYGQKPGHLLGVPQPAAGNASALIEQALRQDQRYRDIPGFRQVP